MVYSTLNRRLNEFRCMGKYCDVNIRVQDTTFHCHRLVLASMCPFFDAVFNENNTEESQSKDVVLNTIDAVTFKTLLDYIYKEQVPNIDSSNVEIFLKAGIFLEIDAVVSECSEFIKSHTSILTYSQLFRLLDLTYALNILLKDDLSEYMTQNLVNFIQHSAFLEIPYEILKIIMERYQSSVSYKRENFLLDGLIRWIFHSYQGRRKYFEELCKIIDFEKISSEYVEYLSKNFEVVDKLDVNDKASLRLGIEKLVLEGRYARGHQLLSMYEDPQISGNLTMHVFYELGSETETDYKIFSLDERKVEPEWICSRRFSKTHSNEYDSPIIELFAFNDRIYCFELVSSTSSTWSHPSFGAYSSLDFASESSEILSPFPLTKENDFLDSYTRMTGFGNNSIYLHSMNTYDFSRVNNSRYVKNFNKEEYERHFYEYNITLDEWLPVNPMKRLVSDACLMADDELVYLVGGKDRGYYMGNERIEGYAQAYNPRLKTWLKLPRTNFPHKNSAGCNLNGRIYVWNGDRIEVYDPQALQWRATQCRFPPKEENEGKKLLVPFKNQLYLFDFYDSEFCSYNPLSQEWSSLFPFDTFGSDEDKWRLIGEDVKNIIVFKSF